VIDAHLLSEHSAPQLWNRTTHCLTHDRWQSSVIKRKRADTRSAYCWPASRKTDGKEVCWGAEWSRRDHQCINCPTAARRVTGATLCARARMIGRHKSPAETLLATTQPLRFVHSQRELLADADNYRQWPRRPADFGLMINGKALLSELPSLQTAATTSSSCRCLMEGCSRCNLPTWKVVPSEEQRSAFTASVAIASSCWCLWYAKMSVRRWVKRATAAGECVKWRQELHQTTLHHASTPVYVLPLRHFSVSLAQLVAAQTQSTELHWHKIYRRWITPYYIYLINVFFDKRHCVHETFLFQSSFHQLGRLTDDHATSTNSVASAVPFVTKVSLQRLFREASL